MIFKLKTWIILCFYLYYLKLSRKLNRDQIKPIFLDIGRFSTYYLNWTKNQNNRSKIKSNFVNIRRASKFLEQKNNNTQTKTESRVIVYLYLHDANKAFYLYILFKSFTYVVYIYTNLDISIVFIFDPGDPYIIRLRFNENPC